MHSTQNAFLPGVFFWKPLIADRSKRGLQLIAAIIDKFLKGRNGPLASSALTFAVRMKTVKA